VGGDSFMSTTQTISAVLVSSAIMAVIHYLAIELSWYYSYPYIDIALHLLGGFTTALLVFYILRSAGLSSSAEFALGMIALLLIVVTAGWEVFEQAFTIARDAGFSMDTLSDVIFGFVGGLIGWALATS